MSATTKQRWLRIAAIWCLSTGIIILGAVSLWPPSRVVIAPGGAIHTAEAAPGLVFAEGGCTRLRWDIPGVAEVRLNGVVVANTGEARVCVTSAAQPAFDVVVTAGTPATRTMVPVAIFMAHPLGGLVLVSGALGLLLLLALPFVPAPPPAPAAGAPFGRRAQYALRGCLSLIGGIVLIVFATGLLLEGALRFYYTHFGSEDDLVRYVFPGDQFPNLEPMFMPLPMVNFGLAPQEDAHNHLGWRGPEIAVPKPEGTYRIVAMGASSVYGPTADWRLAYPAALERILREDYGYAGVEVVNAGIQAYTSWNTVANLATRVLELEPDLVIVYDGFNDVIVREAPPQCYRGLNPLRGLDPHWSLIVDETPDLSASVAVRFLTLNLGMTPDPAGFAGVFEPYHIDCGGGEQTLFAFNSPQVGGANFAHNPPVYFEQNLRTAVGIARIHHIRLMLSTFAYWAEGPGLVGYYRTGMDEHNAIIRALAAEYHLPWVDYAALASQDPAQWIDYIHFSPEGTRAQAAAYAEYIDAQGMIPRDLANR